MKNKHDISFKLRIDQSNAMLFPSMFVYFPIYCKKSTETYTRQSAILKKKGSELLEEIIENFNCFLIKIKKLAVIYVLRTAN